MRLPTPGSRSNWTDAAGYITTHARRWCHRWFLLHLRLAYKARQGARARPRCGSIDRVPVHSFFSKFRLCAPVSRGLFDVTSFEEPPFDTRRHALLCCSRVEPCVAPQVLGPANQSPAAHRAVDSAGLGPCTGRINGSSGPSLSQIPRYIRGHHGRCRYASSSLPPPPQQCWLNEFVGEWRFWTRCCHSMQDDVSC